MTMTNEDDAVGGSGSAASDAGNVEGASRGRQSQNGGRMPTGSPPPPRRRLRIPHHPSQLSQRRVSGLAEEEEEEGERQRTLLSLTSHLTLLSRLHILKLELINHRVEA